MEEFQDYTIHNGIGIRVRGNNCCRVIRLIKGEWAEIGSDYSMPVDADAVCWTKTGIPATMLAVALRVYELDHPTSPLRSILTGRPAAVRARVNRPAPARYQLATAK